MASPMKTEISDDQKVEFQESPIQAAKPQESPIQAAKPQEPPIQAAEPQESPIQDAAPLESLVQDGGLHESTVQDATAQESPLQDAIPQESQESPHQDAEPPVEVLKETPFADRPNVRLSVSGSEAANKYASESSHSILQALLAENKKYRVEEACLRLKEREAESERKLQEERKLNYQKSKGSRKLRSTNSEEKRELSSQISVASLSSTSGEEEGDILQTQLDDGIVEEVDLASFTSWSSNSTVKDTEDMDSDDVMRTAVNELMLVPSLSDFSLSADSVLRLSPSTKSLKSTKSAKSTKSIVPDTRITEPELDSSESFEEETSIESRMETPQKLLEDEVSQEASQSMYQLAAEFNEIPFDEVQPMQPDDNLHAFFAAQEAEEVSRATAKFLAIQKAIETAQIVRDFLNMMIGNVIGYLDPHECIRHKLDKNKLLNGLLEKAKEHIELISDNLELNDQMVEYCRFTKNYRSFAELSAENSEKYERRFKAGLDYLSYAQTRVDMIRTKVAKLIITAQLELSNVMHNYQGVEHHFEETMRRVVIRPDSESDLLKRLVAYELRHMAEKRNEVSDTRFLLIMQKHNLGKLTDQIKRLDTLSETVSMNDYIDLQTKVLSLDKKLEERNLDLKRLHSQYHTDLHLIKHNREKALALKDRLNSLQEQLIEKNLVKKGLKDKLYKAKMEKKKIREETNELAFQGGILSMPSLMYDYDRTMLYIQEKQERVSALQETMQSLTQHLNSVCSRRSTKSTIQL